jgi:hypothetical protein
VFLDVRRGIHDGCDRLSGTWHRRVPRIAEAWKSLGRDKLPRTAHVKVTTPREAVAGAIENARAKTVRLVAVCQPVGAHVDDLSRTAESNKLGVVQRREERVLEITHVEEHIEERCDVIDPSQWRHVGD